MSEPSPQGGHGSRFARGAVALTVLAFVLVLVAANRDYLIGRAFPIFDADGFFAPYYMFLADLIRAGQLLTWNPFNNAGSPDFADPQVGAFDPILLAFGWLTGSRVLGFLVYWLVMWSTAGVGILFLARRLGCGMPLGLVVALGFAFCGFFLGHTQHTSFVRSFAFLGLILWRLDVALVSARPRAAIQSGVLWGLSGLGGYPALLFLNLVAAGAWAVGRLFLLEQERASPSEVPDERLHWPGAGALRNGSMALALLVGAGVLVLLPTYLGTIVEAEGYTSRSGAISRELALESNALHPLALSTFASPYLAVVPKAKLWNYTDTSSCGLYVGVPALVLALFALVARPRSVWRWALVAAAAFALCAALSRVLPLRGWLYDWVPPTRYFRHASVCRAYAIFSVAVLALLGARDLLAPPRTPGGARTWTLTVAFLVAAAGLAFVAFARFERVLTLARVDAPQLVRQHLYAMWIGAPACVTAAWLLRGRPGARWIPIAALIALAVADACLSASFVHPITRNPPERVAALWAELEQGELRSFDLLAGNGAARAHVSNASAGLGPGFNSKNMLRRQPMYRTYTTLSNEIHLEWDKDPRARQPYMGAQRFYFAERVGRTAADRPGDLLAFQRRTKRLDPPPIVIEDDGAETFEATPIAELSAAVRVTPTLKEYTLRRLAFDVDVPRDGWLLVTDRWARSWQVRVNAEPAKIWKGNFLFRAVQVHAGTNSIEFRYQPFGFPWLTLLSWFVVAAALVVPAANWCLQGVRARGQARVLLPDSEL